VVVLLLVVGILLAVVWIPSWEKGSGGVVGILSDAKLFLEDHLPQALQSVKDTILPQSGTVTDFKVAPQEVVAPATMVFTIQTSPNVTDVRVVDDQGNVLLPKTLTDADLLNHVVIQNKNSLIWSLTYNVNNAYNGYFTAQAMQKDGSWDDGLRLATPVSVAPPIVVAPPIQGFECDTTEERVPVEIGFIAETSEDVIALRLVDGYFTTVFSMERDDGEDQDGKVIESDSGYTWEWHLLITEAYEGSYTLQYQTGADPFFVDSDHEVYIVLTEPAPLPTSFVDEGLDDMERMLGEGEGNNVLVAVGGVTEAPATSMPTQVPTAAPTPALSPAPTSASTPEPTVALTPAPTLLPVLNAQADEEALPSAISLKATAYIGQKTIADYYRQRKMSMLDTAMYAVWEQSGVITFRGGPFRQNAAYGTVEITEESLAQVWRVEVGGMKLKNSSIYGIAWPGQPIIVKWPTELRGFMAIYPEKRQVKALKEVILGAQDGRIYFLDLSDGSFTRDPIESGTPFGGGASIATNGTPILGMGQSHGNLANKTIDNGYHLYDLLTNRRIYLLSSRDKAANATYTGVMGAALFDKITGTMVVASQNGLLYTLELGEQRDTFDTEAIKLTVPKEPPSQRYKTQARKQDKNKTKIDGSVAMYNHYVYYGDETGVLQCVDINTLQPVWAVMTGDDIDATPALEMESTGTLALYTANKILYQGKGGVCHIRKFDGLTGKLLWEYQVPDLAYVNNGLIGCIASPVIGEYAIQDLVIFTATNGNKGSYIIALQKSNGELVWSTYLNSASLSSPVAVYNEQGDAWLVQAESNGNVHLLVAQTGEIRYTLELDGIIEASPAVYRNMLVIGTTGKDTGAIYGILLQ